MKPARGSALLALVLLILPLSAPVSAAAQAAGPGDPVKIWVVLKDKGPGAAAQANAALRSFRGARAFENLPLHEPYLETLRAQGFDLDVRLKWQNRVSGRIAPDRMAALRALPFVAAVSLMPRKARKDRLFPEGPRPWRPGASDPGAWGGGRGLGKRAADAFDYGAAKPLVDSLRVAKVHSWLAASGMPPGQGIRIAVIDADFHLGSPIFTAMKGRIRDQWDFVDDKAGAVTNALLGSHGAQCMSLIGGNLPGTLVGMAPEAEFLLYRAEENAQERYVEEDWVAAAIERAVDSGAQVISISLGYRYDFSDGSPDLPYSEFDGRTRPSSIAAVGAARRNVLVSVSMGNEGNLDGPGLPPTLSTPADADSILAVGIVDESREHCSYSSTGPSADGRIKPDVVSMGVACVVPVAGTSSAAPDVDHFAGTSFAAPAIAGVAALMRQLRPDLSAEEIRQALLSTAGNHGEPDDEIGHGLVNAAAAAKRIGVPINPVLVESGLSRLYHTGGVAPLILDWDPGAPPPSLQLMDLTGRLIPITVSVAGTQLFVQPDHPLQTGIYIARVR